jgi:hypothetical protein
MANVTHIYISFDEMSMETSAVVLYELFTLTLMAIEVAQKKELTEPLSGGPKRILEFLNLTNLPFVVAVNVFAYWHSHLNDPYVFHYAGMIGFITLTYELLIKVVIELKKKK